MVIGNPGFAPWAHIGTEGKGEAVSGHSLPVVAVGSIPHIYRRAGLAPGDSNGRCPKRGTTRRALP